MGFDAVIGKAREVIGDGPTYFSFDIDSLDPAFAPGTGTPEVGGLTTREALDLIRGMRGANLVGGDVVEVAPAYDATTNTAQNGAQNAVRDPEPDDFQSVAEDFDKLTRKKIAVFVWQKISGQ